jgi:hypothetical protein
MPIPAANHGPETRLIRKDDKIRGRANNREGFVLFACTISAIPHGLKIYAEARMITPGGFVRGIRPVKHFRIGIRDDASVKLAVQIEMQRVRNRRSAWAGGCRLWRGMGSGGGVGTHFRSIIAAIPVGSLAAASGKPRESAGASQENQA